MISPKICHCIHPFFRKYAPVSTPSSYCIRYSVIKRYSVIVLYKMHIVQWKRDLSGFSLKVFCLFVVSRVSPLEGREAASSDETPPTHKEGEALEGAQGERGCAEVQRGLLVWQKRI